MLFGSLFSLTESSYAQGARDGAYQGGSEVTTDSQSGFDWRWLLPLLAIPVVLYLMRDTREQERSDYQSQQLAGMKGGEARRERNEEIEETDEVL